MGLLTDFTNYLSKELDTSPEEVAKRHLEYYNPPNQNPKFNRNTEEGMDIQQSVRQKIYPKGPSRRYIPQ